MYQYRTNLQPPENATVLGNGTRLKLSELSADERNSFTIKKYKIVDYEGREG